MRKLIWWIWPSFPTAWSQVPSRLRPAATQISRLTVAAVVAYVVSIALSPGVLDLTAPLTALLVVQASTVSTLQMGLVRVGAVLTGVLVAVGLSSYFGLSWWSLAIVIAASLVLAKVMRLGEQSLEAPISAMLILGVTTPQVAAEVRVVNTLVGTLVGAAFSLLVPIAIPDTRARDEVRRVARSQAALLDEVASTLGDRPPDPAEAEAWSMWGEDIGADIEIAAATLQDVEERRKLNPRSLASAPVHPRLRSALERLDRCLAAERALLVMIGRQESSSAEGTAERAAEMRRAFAVVLDDLANGLRAFGDLIGADHVEASDEALGRIVDVVHETRAVLTELVLINVDPREETDMWMLQGSVLAAVDQILRQLDLEHEASSMDPETGRRGLDRLPTSKLSRHRGAAK
jgi:hypothetical protein